MPCPDKTDIFSFLCAGIFAFALAFAVSVEAATVYVWRDDNGVRQYTDYCPPGEKCRAMNIGSSDGGGGTGGKGKSWKNADTTNTDPTDSGTSTSSGDTTDTATTSGDASSGDTTAGTDTTASEPTTSGDTTTTDTTSTTTTDTGAVADGSATLEWDPVVVANLGGYHVFYAMAGTEYQPVNVGNSTTYTMTGLESGKRYYFRVSAYDLSGNQSDFSNEVYKDIQ